MLPLILTRSEGNEISFNASALCVHMCLCFSDLKRRVVICLLLLPFLYIRTDTCGPCLSVLEWEASVTSERIPNCFGVATHTHITGVLFWSLVGCQGIEMAARSTSYP